MQLDIHGLRLYHDVRSSFSSLLRNALQYDVGPIGVALGPIYQEDPAQKVLFPFIRADVETGWSGKPQFPDGVPVHVLRETKRLRQEAVARWESATVPAGLTSEDIDELDDWARAGLVLEICTRVGVNVRGLGKAHVNWRLKGTETGRFGASYSSNKSSAFPNGFNPLTIPKQERNLVVPKAGGRLVCVIDFKAIDLCSMIKLVPGLGRHYEDAVDLHARTAEIIGGDLDRDIAKEQIFVHAYGGQSIVREQLERALPELNAARRLPHGEFPRRVQALSAKAFRAGLAKALPLLLFEDVIPMFTVHDELVLDIDEGAVDKAIEVSIVMQEGATARIGVEYRTSLGLGLNYAEAKA